MNFSLPEATTFDRRVPKARFYEHLDVPASARRALTGQVKTVWWRNKLAASTLHVAAGKSVTEIEVFEIELQAETLDESVLRLLDAQIPYHILFVLTREGRAQAWIGYKEAAGGGDKAFKVVKFYHTDWMPREALRFTLDGLDLDAVYAGLVRAVRGGADAADGQPASALADDVARDIRREKLGRQIAALEKKLAAEKQPRRKYDLVHELRRLKGELGEILG